MGASAKMKVVGATSVRCFELGMAPEQRREMDEIHALRVIRLHVVRLVASSVVKVSLHHGHEFEIVVMVDVTVASM